MCADRNRTDERFPARSSGLPSREDEEVRRRAAAREADLAHELRRAELGTRIMEAGAALERARKAGDQAEVERLGKLQGKLWRERSTLVKR